MKYTPTPTVGCEDVEIGNDYSAKTLAFRQVGENSVYFAITDEVVRENMSYQQDF